MDILNSATTFLINHLPVFYYLTAGIGAITVFSYFFQMIMGVYKLFRKRINLQVRYEKGSWVVVTGASRGIGKQFAIQFAKEGFNVILMASTEADLKKVKQQINEKYPTVEVVYLVVNLIQLAQKQKMQQVCPQLSQYNISIVVNNAGVDVLGEYLSLSLQSIINLIHINCFAVAALNYFAIEHFTKRLSKQGKKSAIINVSSVAGEMPLVLHNVYSASKAYVDKLTKNLYKEYPEIDWLVLRPSQVSTAMTCYKKLDIFTITPKQCAVGTINDLGHDLQTNGHISHKIQSFIYSLVPKWLFNLCWKNVFAKQFMEDRKKYEQSLKKSG